MSHRQQHILGPLYRPPTDGTHQVSVLLRRDAEKSQRVVSTAVISITATARTHTVVASKKLFARPFRVLRRLFDDCA